MLFVTAHIEKFGDSMYMAWAEGFKGLVVQAESKNDVKRELLISLRAKVAFDYNLPITKVDGKEMTDEFMDRIFTDENNDQYKVPLLA